MNGVILISSLLACVVIASAINAEADGDNYIIGGRDAARNQFPWLVAVRASDNTHRCGGFILSDRWVATAAHCLIFGARPENLLVASGAHTRTDGNRHRVSRVVPHPRFNMRHTTHDIGLLQVQDRIPVTPQGPIRTINFPRGPDVRDGTVAFVAGYGFTVHPRPQDNPGAGIPRVVQYIQTRTISRQQCQQAVGSNIAYRISPETICTANPKGRGIAPGDSGGPLVDAQGTCIAIASWSRKTGRGYPDVHLRLWSVIPFIRATTQNTIPNLPQGPR